MPLEALSTPACISLRVVTLGSFMPIGRSRFVTLPRSCQSVQSEIQATMANLYMPMLPVFHQSQSNSIGCTLEDSSHSSQAAEGSFISTGICFTQLSSTSPHKWQWDSKS